MKPIFLQLFLHLSWGRFLWPTEIHNYALGMYYHLPVVVQLTGYWTHQWSVILSLGLLLNFRASAWCSPAWDLQFPFPGRMERFSSEQWGQQPPTGTVDSAAASFCAKFWLYMLWLSASLFWKQEKEWEEKQAAGKNTLEICSDDSLHTEFSYWLINVFGCTLSNYNCLAAGFLVQPVWLSKFPSLYLLWQIFLK